MKALLDIRGASFGYDGVPVLSGVDLEVGPGAFLGILGPNGSGKTTLFRGILGLASTLAGEVRRGTQRIGYVPQRESLDAVYPLTTEEVVHMGAYGRLRGWRALPRADRELASGALARVGVADRARRPFASLSGGQRQRALIARALMARPELLLLDEPTSGVDAHAARSILDLLQTLRREDGLAVLLVSHDHALVNGAVEEVLLVADGAVRRETPDVHEDPEGLDPARPVPAGGG